MLQVINRLKSGIRAFARIPTLARRHPEMHDSSQDRLGSPELGIRIRGKLLLYCFQTQHLPSESRTSFAPPINRARPDSSTMGVQGLWTILSPCARPVKLETLAQKRLAVDASIWIYQFLKAVRDKEGNALRNSHVVGFFRRICKLLFFGIKPVFVFDGGAPALKRATITGRKMRREGRREDAIRTAGRLLAMQMKRRAEGEREQRRKEYGHTHTHTP